MPGNRKKKVEKAAGKTYEEKKMDRYLESMKEKGKYININCVMRLMMEYQEHFKVTRECVMHSVLFYDLVGMYWPEKKFKPVAGTVFWFDDEKKSWVVCAHCWCKSPETSLDPSAEIANIPYTKTYIEDIDKFLERVDPDVWQNNDREKHISSVLTLRSRIDQCIGNTRATPIGHKDMMMCVKTQCEMLSSMASKHNWKLP